MRLCVVVKYCVTSGVYTLPQGKEVGKILSEGSQIIVQGIHDSFRPGLYVFPISTISTSFSLEN